MRCPFVVLYDADVLYPSPLRDNRDSVYGAVQRIADSRGNPPATFSDVLAMLERDGLVESVAALRP